ncbi:MAG: hypothetical protein KF852_04370 [Saprospiraceae bacterium]|nr:hypothetical protein [Saprospiraceae bacterium]
MRLNKILIAALAGTVVFFLLGWLVWGIVLRDFMAANYVSSGILKADKDMILWAMVLGNFAAAFLLAFIFDFWANISTFVTGAKAGALIFGLIAVSMDLVWYASANILNLNGTIADIIASTVVGAIVGGVIGLVLGRGVKK